MALLDFIAAGAMLVYVCSTVQPVNTNDGVIRKNTIQTESYFLDYNLLDNSKSNIGSNRILLSNSIVRPYRP